MFCSSTDTQRNSWQGSIIDKLFTISSKTNEKKVSFSLKHPHIFRTSFSDFLFLIPMTLPKIPRYMQSKKPTLRICQHFSLFAYYLSFVHARSTQQIRRCNIAVQSEWAPYMQHYWLPAQDVDSFLKDSMFRFPFFVKSKFTPFVSCGTVNSNFIFFRIFIESILCDCILL